MAKYIMFGDYTADSIKDISAERTGSAKKIVSDAGGTLKAGYALLGVVDLVLLAEFPNTEAAMKASVDLSKLTGIAFTTAPAVSMEEFDQLVG